MFQLPFELEIFKLQWQILHLHMQANEMSVQIKTGDNSAWSKTWTGLDPRKHGLDWTRENMDWTQKTWTQVENTDSGSNASASSIDERITTRSS